MKWIRTASLAEYDVLSAFEEFESLYWKKSNFSISAGDIIYLYIGKPVSKILFKTICIRDDVLSSDPKGHKDIKYWKTGHAPKEVYECIEIKLLGKTDNDDLSIENLRSLGLISGNIQGAFKETKYKKLFEYIDNSFDQSLDADRFFEEVERDIPMTITGSERLQLIKGRVNQGYYRDLLLQKYKKCCLCGISNNRFLVASHIKPWASSTPAEKVDAENGLLLCPNHDKLFDSGMITFDEHGTIIVSDEISSMDQLLLNIREGMTLQLTSKMKKYMDYHRRNVFKAATNELKMVK